MEAYRRVQGYLANPRQTVAQFAYETISIRNEIQTARELLPKVMIPNDVATLGLKLINNLNINSLRAELTLFEAARAYAAADGRQSVSVSDIGEVASMALRLRKSKFIHEYLSQQTDEDAEIDKFLQGNKV